MNIGTDSLIIGHVTSQNEGIQVYLGHRKVGYIRALDIVKNRVKFAYPRPSAVDEAAIAAFNSRGFHVEVDVLSDS